MGKSKIPALIVLLLLMTIAFYLLYENHITGQKASHIEATGTIEASVVNLNAKLPGTISYLSVNNGDTVLPSRIPLG